MSYNFHRLNYIKGLSVKDLEKGDLIYIRHDPDGNGKSFFLCILKSVSPKNKKITATVIEVQKENLSRLIDMNITAPYTDCALWGGLTRWHFFGTNGYIDGVKEGRPSWLR